MQVGVPSASLRYTDSGVSRSDSTSRTTGTRTRMPGARGSGACGDCGDGDADLVTRRFLGGRMGGVDGGCMPPSPTQVGKNRSEEHTSELQSLMRISYAVFCLKKKKNIREKHEYATLYINRHTNNK